MFCLCFTLPCLFRFSRLLRLPRLLRPAPALPSPGRLPRRLHLPALLTTTTTPTLHLVQPPTGTDEPLLLDEGLVDDALEVGAAGAVTAGFDLLRDVTHTQIGRASCRERGQLREGGAR